MVKSMLFLYSSLKVLVNTPNSDSTLSASRTVREHFVDGFGNQTEHHDVLGAHHLPLGVVFVEHFDVVLQLVHVALDRYPLLLLRELSNAYHHLTLIQQ